MTKKEFVKAHLEPLIKALNSNIAKVDYLIATPSNEEYVEILYTWDDGLGQSAGFRKRICVTADSLSAMTQDVVKKI